MDRKWPLDKEVSASAIRTKVDELLARSDEFTPLWRHALTCIRSEADTIARIVADMDDAALNEREELARMGVALGKGLTDEMAEGVVDDAITARNWTKRSLTVAAVMTSDIVESIGRSAYNDIDRILDGDVEQFLDEVAYAVEAQWSHEQRRRIDEALKKIAQEASNSADKSKNHRKQTISRAIQNGQKRNRERINAVVQAAIENYGLQERIAPRLAYDNEKRQFLAYEWGIGLPITGEDPLKTDDPRRNIVPNGSFEISYAVNSIGEMHPREISRIAAEVQRILLIVGRDIEIDGFNVPLTHPPACCIAGALPLIRMIRSGQIHDVKHIEESGGIATCKNLPIDEAGLATLTSDPLLDGTTVTYSGHLPETIKQALTVRADVPLHEVISHDAFNDDRIVVRRTEVQRNGDLVFYINCPVERLEPLPQGIELEQDPVAAWSDYGRRALIDTFYAGVHAALAEESAIRI